MSQTRGNFQRERMSEMNRIIVACGSGVATSRTVAQKVERLLEEQGISSEVVAIDINAVDRQIEDCVAYVAITKVTKEYPVPVINGITFLTGVGQDAELRKLIKACE